MPVSASASPIWLPRAHRPPDGGAYREKRAVGQETAGRFRPAGRLGEGSQVNSAVQVGDPLYQADVAPDGRLRLIVAVEHGLKPVALILHLVPVHIASLPSDTHMGSAKLRR